MLQDRLNLVAARCEQRDQPNDGRANQKDRICQKRDRPAEQRERVGKRRNASNHVCNVGGKRRQLHGGEPACDTGKDTHNELPVFHQKAEGGGNALGDGVDVYAFGQIEQRFKQLVQPFLHSRKNRGERLGQLRRVLHKGQLRLVGRHDVFVLALPLLAGRNKALIGQLLQHKVGALRLVVGGGQFFVKSVFAGSGPVEHIGKRSGHGAGAHRLVDGLGQAVNGDGIAVGRPCADRAVQHLVKLFLAQVHSLQVGQRRRRCLFVPQHAVQFPEAGRRLVRSIACVLAGHLKRSHNALVFGDFVAQLTNRIHDPTDALNDRFRAKDVAKVRAFQAVRRVVCSIRHILQLAFGMVCRVGQFFYRLLIDPFQRGVQVCRRILQLAQRLVGCALHKLFLHVVGRLFRPFQGDLGRRDLALQTLILFPADLALGKLLLHLLFGGAQRFQFVAGCLDLLAQKPLLLRQQFGVGGVELQQALDVLQLALCVADFSVDCFKGLVEPRHVAADFDVDALYSVGLHALTSHREKAVNVRLRCFIGIVFCVVLALDHHVIDHANRHVVQVGPAQAQFRTAQHKGRAGRLTDRFPYFFLGIAVVWTLAVQSSLITGKISYTENTPSRPSSQASGVLGKAGSQLACLAMM